MTATSLKLHGAVTFSNDILTAKNELLAPANPQGWIIVGYTGPNSIGLQHKGNGGVAELVPKLSDDQVQYILVRLPEPQEGAKTPTKDVFLTWVGPNVKVMERGKKKAHVPDVANYLKPHHWELEAINRANFSESTIRTKSHANSGSHIID